jgi:hypothetical protein
MKGRKERKEEKKSRKKEGRNETSFQQIVLFLYQLSE